MTIKFERLEGIIRKEVSLILMSEVKDPTLKWVTITDVQLTKDYSTAKIFVTFPQGQNNLMENLEKAKGFIRSSLGSKLKVKKIPSLVFEVDDSLERGNRIDEILKATLKD
jgi:ribosome-binding factor A